MHFLEQVACKCSSRQWNNPVEHRKVTWQGVESPDVHFNCLGFNLCFSTYQLLPRPQAFYPLNEDFSSTCFIRLNEIIHKKHWVQSLAHHKCWVKTEGKAAGQSVQPFGQSTPLFKTWPTEAIRDDQALKGQLSLNWRADKTAQPTKPNLDTFVPLPC